MQTHLRGSVRIGTSGAAAAALSILALTSTAHAGDPVTVTDLITRPLANVPGKEVTMITVDYAPGGADPVHRHDASAFVYVLEGSVDTSDTEPAKFLVFLVKKQGAPILIPVSR
jgi:quercetin dioxygenase-like cupin family protein